MENTAMKMREIATAYHEAREAEAKANAKNLVEKAILKEIEEAANGGSFFVNRYVSAPLRDYVKVILREMGFTVDKGMNNTFDIKW